MMSMTVVVSHRLSLRLPLYHFVLWLPIVYRFGGSSHVYLK